MSDLGQILHPRFNCTFNTVDIPSTQCYNIFSLSEIKLVLVQRGRRYYYSMYKQYHLEVGIISIATLKHIENERGY